ncbi:MAG: ferritin-like domain-containing protein [Acidimicrobiales bacterium]
MSTDQIMPTDADDAPGSSRRWFLGAAAAVTAGGVLAACGKNDDKSDTTASTTATTAAAGTTATTAAAGAGDAKVAALAAGLEKLAVDTYKGALDAATAKKLGDVPPAVATFATTAMGHHQTALDAWNKVLTSGGGQAVSTPLASVKTVVDKEFAAVKDVTGVAKLALLLEQTAADTYLSAIDGLQSKDAITLAGALQSVDQEHAAILLFVLGMYPVPDVFQKTDKAVKG